MRKYLSMLALLSAVMFLYCGISEAAPRPKGDAYEVLAKILSLKKVEVKGSIFDFLNLAPAAIFMAKIEIESVGLMSRRGQYPKGVEHHDNYTIGQKLDVKLIVKGYKGPTDLRIFAPGTRIDGIIYSYSDGVGDQYNLVVTKK